ncbi:MAG: hypothetical protein ABI823_21875 [Bryobacteraceae bacterium]
MSWIPCIVVLVLCSWAATGRASQEDPVPKPADKKTEVDTFFSGTVFEFNEKQLIVLRTVLGKPERRTFVINETTKVEGKLRQRIRVTVKFEPTEGGDVARLVRVRAPQALKKK